MALFNHAAKPVSAATGLRLFFTSMLDLYDIETLLHLERNLANNLRWTRAELAKRGVKKPRRTPLPPNVIAFKPASEPVIDRPTDRGA